MERLIWMRRERNNLTGKAKSSESLLNITEIIQLSIFY